MESVIVCVARRAFASEGSIGVDAGAVFAQTRDQVALVDIITVWWHPSASAVLDPSGALLTGTSPTLTDGGAAELLVASDSGNLVHAGVVGARQEARSDSVVCLAPVTSETVGADALVRLHASSAVETTRSADWLGAVGSSESVRAATFVVDAASAVHASQHTLLV